MEQIKETFGRYPKFFVVGVLGTLFNLAVTYLFTESFGWWYLLSYVLSSFLTWTLNFFLNSYFTFAGHSKEGYLKKYFHYLSLNIVVYLANIGLVFVLTSILGVYYLISIAAVTLGISIVSFLVSQKHIFHSKP